MMYIMYGLIGVGVLASTCVVSFGIWLLLLQEEAENREETNTRGKQVQTVLA